MHKFLLVAAIVLSTSVGFCFVPGTKASAARITSAQAILHAIVKDQDPLPPASQVIPALHEAMNQLDPQFEAFDPANNCRTDADIRVNGAIRIRAKLDEIYPEYTEDDLKKIAEERYPLVQNNERIVIYYHDRPNHIAKLEGYYKGSHGGAVNISGKHRIPFRDMKGIVFEDPIRGRVDNEEEIIRLDPMLNSEKRTELCRGLTETRNAQRAAWRKENTRKLVEEQGAIEGAANEAMGYTMYNGDWMAPDVFLATLVINELSTEAAHRAEKLQEEQEKITALVDGRIDAIIAGEVIAPMQGLCVPEARRPKKQFVNMAAKVKKVETTVLAANEEVDNSGDDDSDSAVEDVEENESEDDGEEESDETEEADEENSEAESSAEPKARAQVPPSVIDDEPTSNMMVYMMIGLVLLLTIAAGGYMYIKRKKEDEDLDVSEFFKGEGDDQKIFWESADADPENFHYVAYLFPNPEAADEALTSLSFIFIGEDDHIMHSSKNISYGTYEHKLGSVAYVGGVKLNYALWREASAVWPELPKAKYFKVSQEPKVQLVLPSMDNFDSTQIQEIGIEDIRGETGEITRVYRYKAVSVEIGLKFIEAFEVQEDGIVVNVETPTRKYGKDINGVFEIQDAE